jgi:hypothetical protein
MNVQFRLTIDHLFEALEEWDLQLKRKLLVVACGGTALTLLGHKESTKDVDFLIPITNDFARLVRLLESSGYHHATTYGYKHPTKPWIFDLFRGQTVFQTELLDPIHLKGNHRVIRKLKHLTVGCLNPSDLIISKMFRGDQADIEDSIVMIKSENIDLFKLGQRYKETAGYYFNPPNCKTNLTYLIADLKEHKFDTSALEEMNTQWIP